MIQGGDPYVLKYVWLSVERVPVVAVVLSRSTQALFTDPFAPTGGESARIDRIAMARGADLRDNQFAKWGAR